MNAFGRVGRWGKWLLACGTAAPSLAWACPACAGRGGFNVDTALALGSMIFLPFLIAGTVLHIVRRLDSESVR